MKGSVFFALVLPAAYATAVVEASFKGRSAQAQDQNFPVKDAFEAAKELGTTEAWQAFLKVYPTGFHADLARAYLKKLGESGVPAVEQRAPAVPQAPPDGGASGKRTGRLPPSDEPSSAPANSGAGTADVAATDPAQPAVTRGASYMGFPERFNRYYTEPGWQATQTIYVTPKGGGDGSARDKPTTAAAAVAAAKPGVRIVFMPGTYQGGHEFSKATGGTYDDPVILSGERNGDNSIGVKMNCATGSRQTCFNFEGADYIAVDGFEFIGGQYGVRAIGLGFAASQHARGIAVLNSEGHDQDKDPFFSGQVDWAVWENNVGANAKKGDGHGMYLSNGGDWNIVRFNETYGGDSSDFQINPDPELTCKEPGIPVDDPRCDAYAGEGEGGQGASDYFLVDGNYFHHSNGPGANFISTRRSVIRNNIFGLSATKHNVSFYQETDNPRLGASDNRIVHNLFVTTSGRHGVQFSKHSTRNAFVNNVIVGAAVNGGAVQANPQALLMEVDNTVGDNVYRGNIYISGKVEGRTPGAEEIVRADFSPSWFMKFPTTINHDANDFIPDVGAPFLSLGARTPEAPADRNGAPRPDKVDLGPIEVK